MAHWVPVPPTFPVLSEYFIFISLIDETLWLSSVCVYFIMNGTDHLFCVSWPFVSPLWAPLCRPVLNASRHIVVIALFWSQPWMHEDHYEISSPKLWKHPPKKPCAQKPALGCITWGSPVITSWPPCSVLVWRATFCLSPLTWNYCSSICLSLTLSQSINHYFLKDIPWSLFYPIKSSCPRTCLHINTSSLVSGSWQPFSLTSLVKSLGTFPR